jgi:hypothetical protein
MTPSNNMSFIINKLMTYLLNDLTLQVNLISRRLKNIFGAIAVSLLRDNLTKSHN